MRQHVKFDPYEIGLDVRGFSRDEAICLCPFHDDHKPSASMNLHTGLLFCFSCGATADAYRIAAKLGGVVTSGVILVSKQTEHNEWRHLLSFPLAQDNQYLQKREVTKAQIEEYKIREMPSGIIFEVRNGLNDVTGVVVRRYEGNPKYLYFGKRTAIWPVQKLKHVRPGGKLFIVEGVFGALRGRSAGLPVFASLGAMVKQETGAILSSYQVIGLFDSDFAGYVGGGRLLITCPSAKIVIPGQEADEISIEDWQAVSDGVLTTRSLRYLAALSGKKTDFYKYMPKVRRS